MFGWLSGLFSKWPPGVPRLYPDLSDRELSSFLTDAEFERIKRLPLLYILPLTDPGDDEDDICLGVGVSRLLIRDLMLLRGLSVHGPEDTPKCSIAAISDGLMERRPGTYWVGGRFGGDGGGMFAELEILATDRKFPRLRARAPDALGLVRSCAEAIAGAFGVKVEGVERSWAFGRPSSAVSLLELGRLMLDKEPRRQTAAALELFRRDAGFALPITYIDDDFVQPAPLLLEGFRRDPFDAQLCFEIFCNTWKSKDPQPDAVQFLRRAIELSPGHGKAHMCAPHAADPGVNMLRHSELGYRLLPGNSFAVDNYIINLARSGASAKELLKLVQEGIDNDPNDPGPYDMGIMLLIKARAYHQALDIAERLQRLYEPVMGERTRYCLMQNPERKRKLLSGEFDPAAENRALIAKLRAFVGNTPWRDPA